MVAAKHWTVEVFISEDDDETRAEARLHKDDTDVTGVGLARRNPKDRDVPEIGDELAAARAMNELGRKLIGLTAEDIEEVTHQPAHLDH